MVFRRLTRLAFGALLLSGSCLAAAQPSRAQDNETAEHAPDPDRAAPVVLGGGVPFGLYYPLAGAICRLTETAEQDPRRCVVASIPDSAQAISDLREGRVDMALVQSDWLTHAVNGTSRFQSEGGVDGLRAVAALHGEGLVVLVRRDSGIRGPSDLSGARVARGPDRSYRALLTAQLLAAAELSRDDLAMVSREPVDQAVARLCRGETDAVAAVTAAPSSVRALAPAGCELSFLAVDGGTAERASEDMPGVRRLDLPLNAEDRQLTSFGLTAVLTAQADTDPEVVETVARALLGGAKALSGMHPALVGLAPEKLPRTEAFAPRHPAAEDLYQGRSN